MTSKKIYVNASRSRLAIMASKIASGASMNVRQQNASTFVQGPTPELLKAMKNVRE
uniref:Uncharacterized protein n=1 Tax=Picea sitchensis TaxID=3332 RepID=A9NQA8_PICSI|nr:unknown [Picea sitchensis]